MKLLNLIPLAVGLALSVNAVAAQQKLSLDDIMRFESLQVPVISDNGAVVAVEAKPDRGDSRALIRFSDNSKQYEIAQGSNVKVSSDGKFVMADIAPTLLAAETEDKEKLTKALVLLNTESGEQQRFEKIKSAEFSANGQYLVVWFDAEKEPKSDVEKADIKPESEPTEAKDAVKTDKADKGSLLKLVNLATQKVTEFKDVTQYAFDKKSIHLAVAVNQADSHEVSVVNLEKQSVTRLFNSKTEQVGELALSENGHSVAFTHGDMSVERYGREYALTLVDIASAKSVLHKGANGWTYNQYSKLQFSKDNKRLFVGRVAKVAPQAELPKFKTDQDLFDQSMITAKRGLRIWHGEDAKIKPHEIKEYQQELKRTYLAVLHLDSNRMVQLADTKVPDVVMGEQSNLLVARSDVPYKKMITWAGFYNDVYVVDINNGKKTLVAAQLSSMETPSLSPNGRYVAYYQQANVFVYDVTNNSSANLTRKITTPFANEDHDTPDEAPSYGFGPWLADSSGFIAYDKYDAWQFSVSSKAGVMLSNGEGRKQGVEFRVTGLVDNAPEQPTLDSNQTLLLKGYSHKTKADGFYQATVGRAGVSALTNSDSKLTVLARAKTSDRLVYSQQRYDLYPDLYVAKFTAPDSNVQITQLDAQRKPFNWSHSELVQWRDGDGRLMDGVLIKPTNYQAGKQYPVIVYFYEFMSERMHAFPDMKINHRPNFAWFADNGYAIFLPDIRFEIGYPGISSVKALTAGVQKLIDMGIADPKAVGLQGHSWSGYQAAYAITQTNMFAATVSGAPVSNMTSAYSGIRHGSGLARQFQYEMGQSRIAESLYDSPQKYIENSPVFYVERIQTPMLIMFGDIDDAVPWEQGVEMYLAMRRTGKDVVFLQYEGEPHHLQKYPNKLDYTIRMMEYFNHYLKGEKAPEWMLKGEAYQEYKKAG